MHDAPTPSVHQLREALASIRLTRGLTLDDVEVHLRVGLGLHDNGHLVLAFYLADMADRLLHEQAGYSSTVGYAEAVLGLEPRRTRELVAVGRKLATLPALLDAHRAQRIGWSKVLHLMTVVTPEHEDAWLEFALEHTCRDLKREARLTRPGHAPRSSRGGKGTREIRFPVRAMLPALTQKKFRLAQEKLAAERGGPVSQAECIDALAELLLTTDDDGRTPGRRRIDSSLYRIVVRHEDPRPDGDGDRGLVVFMDDLGHVPIDHASPDGVRDAVRTACIECDAQTVHVHDGPYGGRLDEKTPRTLRHRVLCRDDHHCRCCGRTRQLHVHHIAFRARGGRTRAINLITLCDHCHALVHAGLVLLVGRGADEVLFTDRRGRVLHEAREYVDPKLLYPLGEGLGLGLPPEAAAVTPEAPEPVPFDDAFERVVGQPALLSRLAAVVTGSRARGRSFPHTLFTGPPGTGKTTLAEGLARALGARLHRTAGPLLQNTADLLRILSRLREGDVLFLDEVHAVPRPVLETLYEAMAGSRPCAGRRELPPFTLLAATTEDGDLPDALRSRFGLRESLGFYEDEDLARLVAARAKEEGVALTNGAADRLASHARGTPREALRLVERVLDEAARGRRTFAARDLVDRVLLDLGYDAEGLSPEEQRYLALLREVPGPVSLARLARMLGASAVTLARTVEPFLFRMGWVQMTPQGRLASPRLLRKLS